MLMKNGFSLVELMIVVFIIALLAAIPIPLYRQHTQRAVAQEAIATMSLIRQAMRDYFINNGAYFDVSSDHIQDAPPGGAGVDVRIAKYFSNQAYTVDGTSPASARFSSPAAQDFIISVNGANSVACAGSIESNCALSAGRVAGYRLEMDNTGRVFVSFDAGAHWSAF